MLTKIPDSNGFITVKDVPLTKAGVYPYLGKEIGAPEPDKIYYVYRPASELESDETIESFKLAPFIDDHEWLGKGGTPAERKGVQGTIGEQVYYEHPYLKGNVRILSESIKDRIKSGKIELSAGYSCKYVPEQGEFNGERYDYVQRDIRANHLALVDKGRSGADVSIALDQHFTITIDNGDLIMTLEDILKALEALSDEDKQTLRAALAVEDESEAEDEVDVEADTTAEEIKGAVEVLEAAKEAAELVEDEDSDETEDEDETEDKDETEDEDSKETIDRLRSELAKIKRKMKALDTGALLKEISKRDALANRLSEFVGTFDHSSMTTRQVAKYGVKKLGIKCAEGYETIALDAWLQGQTPARKVQDKAPVKTDINKFWSK